MKYIFSRVLRHLHLIAIETPRFANFNKLNTATKTMVAKHDSLSSTSLVELLEKLLVAIFNVPFRRYCKLATRKFEMPSEDHRTKKKIRDALYPGTKPVRHVLASPCGFFLRLYNICDAVTELYRGIKRRDI